MTPPNITRRDLLNGIAVGIGANLLRDAPSPDENEQGRDDSFHEAQDDYQPEQAADYYPPAKTGIRGDHDGSFDAAHALRKGARLSELGSVVGTGEHYDLIVVGAGISGLAAAHFYRQRRGNSARVLILDNHDDFGGHATRNEFSVHGRLLMSYGGSQSIASPEGFSEINRRLMKDLGIDLDVFNDAYDQMLHSKLGTALFFDRETFGQDRLLTGMYTTAWPAFLANAPLPEAVRRDIARIYTEKRDYLAGMSLEAKRDLLSKISYKDYLTKYCRLVPEALVVFQTFPHDLFTVGIDAVSAWSCYHGVGDYGAFIYPGFDGLGLPKGAPNEPYIYHFPDGNASVARLLVRTLVPEAIPSESMHDAVLAKADYAKLDRKDARVRIRLNSTVLRARNYTHAGRGDGVEVVYSRGKKLRAVTAKQCVLACHNAMIPYICPELPRPQRKALAYLVRMPLVYTHVVLRNWIPFAKLGVRQIVAPGGYHNYTALDFPVSLGGYNYPKKSDEPMVLFMLRVPCRPGMTRRDQNRVGRWELLNTSFETFERNIRDQLGRMLAGTGFDPATDIKDITVNRWAHGYAFTPNRLFDPDWAHQDQPWVIGRQTRGGIAIANSDAGASPYLDVAVEQAWRAVDDLVTQGTHT